MEEWCRAAACRLAHAAGAGLVQQRHHAPLPPSVVDGRECSAFFGRHAPFPRLPPMQRAAEKELACLVSAALSPSLDLAALPKAVVEVVVVVLEEGGGAPAAAITAASLAAADAGLPAVDLVPASSVVGGAARTHMARGKGDRPDRRKWLVYSVCGWWGTGTSRSRHTRALAQPHTLHPAANRPTLGLPFLGDKA